MHNYFSHCKSNQENEHKLEEERKYYSYLKNKKQKDDRMVEKFVQRTKLTLYQQLQDGSYKIQKYSDPKYEPRKTNTKLHIGGPSFYYQARTSKDRINQALQKNLNLDEIPFNLSRSPITHRFRQKEENKTFKYTPYDTMSRVMQSVKQQNTNVLETSWNLNLKRYNEKFHRRNRSTYSLQKINQSKNVLPHLTVKHHPKTLESIQNTLNLGTLKRTVLNDITPNENNKLVTALPKQFKIKPMNKKLKNSVKFETIHIANQELGNQLL